MLIIENYSVYVIVNNSPKPTPFCRPPGHGISDKTTITIGDKTFDCDASDLQQRRYLGRGAYGVVEEVEHLPSNTILAVKVGQVEISM